nr:DNA-binding protein WhiA [Maliibacterium massiliense]
MAFSADTKRELAHVPLKRACCRRAELAALARFAGSIGYSRQGMTLSFATDYADVAQRVISTLRAAYRAEAQLHSVRRDKLKKNERYIVTVSGEKVRPLLEDIGVVGRDAAGEAFLEGGIRPDLIEKPCCRFAYARGAFMASGSVTDPQKAYHLEIVSGNDALAQDLRAHLAAAGLNVHAVVRKGNTVIYLKEAEHICELLGQMGAHSAMLHMESTRVLKGVRNRINRSVNCDTANIEKTSNAAAKQIRSIELIEKYGDFRALPLPVRQVAELRLEHPEASLQDLSDMLPGVSRSGVNHRLRSLVDIAAKLQLEREDLP